MPQGLNDHGESPDARMAEDTKVETSDTEKKEVVVEAKEPVEGAEEETTSSSTEEQTDWKAELAKEREAREKAEKALAEDRYKAAHPKAEETTEEVDEDKPLTAKELDARLARERQETRKVLEAKAIQDIATNMANSPEEAALYVEIHRNRTFPSNLTLQEQMEEVYAIANRKKLTAQIGELTRAVRAKQTTKTNSASTHHDAQDVDEPKISQPDAQAMKAAGMTWDGKSQTYIKKLPGGKTLFFDPKTKKRGTR